MIRESRKNLVIVSDLHGCKRAFDKSLSSAYKFIKSPADHMFPTCPVDDLPKFFNESILVFLGDLIDRGPESYKIIKSLDQIPNSVHLCGNHEAVFLKFLYFDDPSNQWGIDEKSMFSFFRFGGMQTLRSFVESGEFIKNDDFLNATYDFRTDDLFYILEDFYPFIADLRIAIRYNLHIQKFFSEMGLSFQMDNFLCVHAGFLYEYLNQYVGLSEPGWVNSLNTAFKEATLDAMQGDFSKFDTFTSVSTLRGGKGFAGPLWADRREILMMTDMNRSRLSEYYHAEGIDTVVVGHSYVDNIEVHHLSEDVHLGVNVYPVRFIFTDNGLSSYYKGGFSSQSLVVDQFGRLFAQDNLGDFDFIDQ